MTELWLFEIFVFWYFIVWYGLTWYRSQQKAVDQRAKLIPNSYKNKARKIDSKYHNTVARRCLGAAIIFWRSSCFWMNFFEGIYLRRVNLNFHAKFRASSFKIDWVIVNCLNLRWWVSEWVSQSGSDKPRYRAVFTAKKRQSYNPRWFNLIFWCINKLWVCVNSIKVCKILSQIVF